MRVFVIAGEPSGDRLGRAVMAGLRQLSPEVSFDGIGGPGMAGEGLRSLFPMEELSVMGIAEVLPRYRQLMRRLDETARAVIETRPDILLTIDSPDFCLRVARRVKAAGAPVRCVHYVAPSVWAWRPGRAAKMARSIDQVLALLPFEPPYMEAAGMECDFVGHPVVTDPQADDSEARAFREQHGIGDAPLLLALPGSRRGEVQRLSETFGAALARVQAALPEARVVLPCAAPVVDLVRAETRHWSVAPLLIDPAQDPHGAEKRAAFRAADVALAASGTVSLELAAADTPMVVAYDMGWVSRVIIGRMLLTDTVTLVNLVSETRSVPEYIGKDCSPEPIGRALLRVLERPEAQRAALHETMKRLGAGGEAPGLRAARSILDRAR
ncbi:lipid-A-disaccharide synthase [Limimaricola cinnabarinus]|uniref:Lipid-A-disaccharide synthase n=1 Tax=Limimaricola cinnabarinus LL-001 TaxID=1337093 RepID=U3AP95_9RHOB|nr:lipid-A-disaccharide synthase [Limimaricola cinnabarinus]GAD56558.1 lipid-A-disaccharide synthase [Limimaricola cinnabarinus LL-001]